MDPIITHLGINRQLVGVPQSYSAGHATICLTTTPEMAADARGLVHGGFTFGLADYAAMVAVNDPNVVLGAASTRFLGPVQVGETLRAEAQVLSTEGKKRMVKVEVFTQTKVMEGEFTCFVLPTHVLDMPRRG